MSRYRKDDSTHLILMRANLRVVCDEYRERQASGERFANPGDYEAFIGGWRRTAKDLRDVSAECDSRGL